MRSLSVSYYVGNVMRNSSYRETARASYYYLYFTKALSITYYYIDFIVTIIELSWSAVHITTFIRITVYNESAYFMPVLCLWNALNVFVSIFI
jgi:hypothetical protein